MKTREQIITSMCFTWRHDYGLKKDKFSGMTDEEREFLRKRMTQIFDNDIAPHMDFRKEPRKSVLVHDGIIKIHSFELTDREKKRISLGLRYGPSAAAMNDDGTYFDPPDTPRKQSWREWFLKNIFGLHGQN